jgi:hypothetical protein
MDQGEYIDFNLYGTTKEDSIITNPLHLFFQEIELAIKIGVGETWGTLSAIDLSKYIFNQYITTEQIKSEILTFIATHCAHAEFFQYNIKVELMNLDNKDFIYIVANIFDEENNKEFLQKFLLGN